MVTKYKDFQKHLFNASVFQSCLNENMFIQRQLSEGIFLESCLELTSNTYAGFSYKVASYSAVTV